MKKSIFIWVPLFGGLFTGINKSIITVSKSWFYYQVFSSVFSFIITGIGLSIIFP